MGELHSQEPMLSDDRWIDRLIDLYSDELEHFGVAHDDDPPGRGSGRYEFGSGERIFQHSWEAYARYRKLKKSGMSDTLIAKSLGFYKTDRFGNPILDENGEPQGNTALLRANVQIMKNEVRNESVQRAMELKETIDPDTGKFYTNEKIGQMLGGVGESTVRNWLSNEGAIENAGKSNEAANRLKEMVDEYGYIDIGRGTELELGISHDRLKVVQEMLKQEGYEVYELKTNQVGMNGEQTTTLVLCPQGASFQDMINNRYDIVPVTDPNGDTTLTRLGLRDPVRVAQDRINIRYDEDGGSNKDGMVEIRAVRGEDGQLYPACDDLSLGNAKYAQVRIAVEGDKYIKGMAVYNEDLPNNVDILVNSNKSVKDGFNNALKDMKDDPDNPFGATVCQSDYIDKNGNKQLSAINIVGDIYGKDLHAEGAWGEWSRNLPSQFLGKQSEALIKQQLLLKVQEKQQELDEIMKLNNPVVKKQMLLDFADGCDGAATDLKAAPLPGQRVHVILPVDSLKDTEVYAPNYPSGTTLALVRFPHAGPFETPVVKVNNGNKEALSFMKDAQDAIGINSRTASILSGADFDGDTVIVIPMTRKNSKGEFEKVVNIKGINNGQEKLPGLDGFDPKKAYPGVDSDGNKLPGVKRLMDKRTKGIEMGVVSNLITDMSIKGCEDPEELARAVKYSMVVIDAEKHKLNYLQAEKDYNIKELKEKYQSNADGSHGVSTILSRAGADTPVPKRSIGYDIDPDTGKKVYKEKANNEYEVEKPVKVLAPKGYTYTDSEGKTHKSKYLKDENGKDVVQTDPKTGKVVYEKTGDTKTRTQNVSRMSTVDDARDLMSDYPSNKEILYADYANKMKALANESRKAYLAVPSEKIDPAAKKKYAAEVDSLNAKLNEALKNAPLERYAQRLANQTIATKKDENPDMSKEELKRVKGQALTAARNRVGASKHRINFTEKEWEAINAHAIGESKLTLMLKNANADNYKALATPRTSRISLATATRIQGLLNAGWTREQIENAGYASMDTIVKVQAGKYDHND